jgi:hypothetical protein
LSNSHSRRSSSQRQSQSGAECGCQTAGALPTSGHTGTGADETCHGVFGRRRVFRLFSSNKSSQTRTAGIQYLVTSVDGNGIATIYQKRWNVQPYHKSLKQNASLEKSPTKTVTTQTNHFFAALCAYIKLKGNTKLNHFALKSKLYVRAIQSAYTALRKLNPVQLAA